MTRLILIIVAMTFVLPAVVFAQSDGFNVGTILVTGEVVEVIEWEPTEIEFAKLHPNERRCQTIFIHNVGDFHQWALTTLSTDDTLVEWSIDDDELLIRPGDRDEVEVCVDVPGDVPAPLTVSAKVDVERLDR